MGKEHDELDETPPLTTRQQEINKVLFFLMLAQSIVFTEAGSIPALLIPLTIDFNLTFPQQGFLGGIVYLGIAVGALLISNVFKHFSAYRVLTTSMVTTAIMVFVFGMVPAGYPNMLIFIRFCIGFGQATLSIFCPVWVERFAPKEHLTKWMSWLQITVPLGIMIGYLFGWGAVGLQTGVGIQSEGKACFNDSLACWRIPFIVQAILIIPVIKKFTQLDPSLMDVGFQSRGGTRGRSLSSEVMPVKGGGGGFDVVVAGSCKAYCHDIYIIVKEFYFSVVVLLIAMMYYLVMSIQYWGTDWLVVGRGYNEHQVYGWFVFTTASAPVLGAILGGYVVDALGGFKGSVAQRSKCMGVLTAINGFGVMFCLQTTYWPDAGLSFAVVCLWITLFCGGMVVPALTGMYTSAIPSARLKILGSSIMLVVTSIFSYFLQPVIAGYMMRSFSSDLLSCHNMTAGTCPEAVELGFRWSLFMGPIAALLTGGVWLGGCFLKGDQLINQDDDYSDLNIPRSIGITGSVDSLASMDSNQEMI